MFIDIILRFEDPHFYLLKTIQTNEIRFLWATAAVEN